MGRKIVPGNGPRNAKIVIVGEAPGRDEEIFGKPFIGPSGQLLNDMLLRCGINRNECYVTHVMKRRPLNNDYREFY